MFSTSLSTTIATRNTLDYNNASTSIRLSRLEYVFAQLYVFMYSENSATVAIRHDCESLKQKKDNDDKKPVLIFQRIVCNQKKWMGHGGGLAREKYRLDY